jgi:cyclic pyranopterin phosphate synthase
MPLVFSLRDLDLDRLPARPGAVVLFDDTKPLYVAQTASMREWVRRLVDLQGDNYIRKAVAQYIVASKGGEPRLSGLNQGVRQQLAQFLQHCSIHLHPESTRDDAIKRKTALLTSLSPKLQQAGRRGSAARTRPSVDSAKALPSEVGHLSHLDESGRPRMVDITAKADTARQAIAKGSVYMKPQTLALIRAGQVAKGDVISVAQVAGVMAAKKTHELIPLCHPLLLTDIDVQLKPDEKESALHITASVRTTGKTGVEMEALTAVAVAALTVYDMCKAVDRGIRIEGVRLARKSGGKSGEIVLE